MEQEFQRADLEALMGGDELLDGQELSCGFVRIAAVGLLMDYRAKRGEEPLFNMHFNSGRPVLPFPFTLEQFKAFCAWHPLFRWVVIEAEFTNDDGTIDGAALAELDSRSLNAGKLLRGILGMPPASLVTVNASEGVERDAGHLAASQPQPQATTPSPAPVVTASTSGGVEHDMARLKVGEIFTDAPKRETQRAASSPKFSMRLDALIQAHIHEWPTIKTDIKAASNNGLSAAKAGARGWWEELTMEWARANGKLKTAEKPADTLMQAMHNLSNLPSRTNRLEG